MRKTALLGLMACNGILGIEPATVRDAGDDRDAAVDDAPPPPACDRTKDFGVPVPIVELNTPQDEQVPRLTHDELTIYFARNLDLVVAHRATRSDPFDATTPLTTVNTTASETNPCPTGDDLTLYFASDRMGGKGGADIWMATRASVSEPYGMVQNVSALNSAGDDDNPYVLPNDEVLYFSRKSTGFDLLRAFRASPQDPFNIDTPTLFKNVNTQGGSQHWEFAPVVTLDESTLYFVSDVGVEWNIYTSTFDTANNVFQQPVITKNINSSSADVSGWISDDGCRLYFLSDRAGGTKGDLYIATKP